MILADEVISIATGFQLVAFSHVIGTMWNASDEAAVDAAREFYGLLMQDEGIIEHRNVVSALYKAVRRARRKWGKEYLVWAPFIHLGA